MMMIKEQEYKELAYAAIKQLQRNVDYIIQINELVKEQLNTHIISEQNEILILQEAQKITERLLALDNTEV